VKSFSRQSELLWKDASVWASVEPLVAEVESMSSFSESLVEQVEVEMEREDFDPLDFFRRKEKHIFIVSSGFETIF